MIEVKNLEKIYTKGKTKIPAVNGISFTVEDGTFVSIVGKSGSGKSTLLNLLAGLDTASSGEMIFDGKNICKFSRKEIADHRRKTIGIVFQAFNLISTKTALENIILALTFGGVKRGDRKTKAKLLLEKVGLQHRFDHYPTELSGGEAQRVAIARALANDPKFILADEPTGNLDTKTTEDILALLQKLKKEEGRTIVMITHDMETALAASDKILTVSDGKLISK